MTDTTQRDALERTIAARLGTCSHEELLTLDAVLVRIERIREDVVARGIDSTSALANRIWRGLRGRRGDRG